MTPSIDNETWARLSPLLDEAMELTPAAQGPWLEELACAEPDLAAVLRELLAEKALLDAGSFLEDSPGRPAAQATLTGQRFGAYEIERLLGQGGMGTVWLAHRCDGRFEGKAAVKLLNAALIGGPGEQRFVREGSVLAALRHPNIAHLVDAGVAACGQPYLVIEHVEGRAIDAYCDEQRLGIRARLRVFLEVLDAVAFAHRHLVVHRDLKPSNILVTEDGTVKLLDFGIAALLSSAAAGGPGEPEMTREIGAALTPEYAAPEQLLGLPVTTATDIYALGRVLYVLLGGPRTHIDSRSGNRTAGRDGTGPELPLLSRVAEPAMQRLLSGDLENIVRKAAKPEAPERYATVEALAGDIRRHLADQPVSARPDSFGYRVGKFARRHRGGVITGALTAIALFGATGFAVMQMLEAQGQRDEALEQTQRAEALNVMLTSLLSQAGPNGQALGPGELLDRAVAEVTARYAHEPRFLVDTLVQISGRYFELRDTNKEYATLGEALAVARGSGDASLVTNVLCNLVETELVAGRLAEAERQMQEARPLLGTMADPPPHLHATCLRAEAELAVAKRDMPRVFEHLEHAARVLRAGGLTDTNAYTGILSKLAKYHSLSGHTASAYRYAVEIAEIDRRAGRYDSMSGLIARISVAVNLYHLGEVRRSLELFREAVPDRGGNPGSPPSVSARAKYGEMLARAGRLDAALPLLADAVAEADRRGHHADGIRTRLLYANALVLGGRAAEAQVPLDTASAMMQDDAIATPLWRVETERLQSEILLAGGRLAEAVAAIASARARLDAADAENEPRLAGLLLTRARVQLAAADLAGAADSARQALALFERIALEPEQSADVGETLLVLARAELASGNPAAARDHLTRATVILRNSLGSDQANLLIQQQNTRRKSLTSGLIGPFHP